MVAANKDVDYLAAQVSDTYLRLIPQIDFYKVCTKVRVVTINFITNVYGKMLKAELSTK